MRTIRRFSIPLFLVLFALSISTFWYRKSQVNARCLVVGDCATTREACIGSCQQEQQRFKVLCRSKCALPEWMRGCLQEDVRTNRKSAM